MAGRDDTNSTMPELLSVLRAKGVTLLSKAAFSAAAVRH